VCNGKHRTDGRGARAIRRLFHALDHPRSPAAIPAITLIARDHPPRSRPRIGWSSRWSGPGGPPAADRLAARLAPSAQQSQKGGPVAPIPDLGVLPLFVLLDQAWFRENRASLTVSSDFAIRCAFCRSSASDCRRRAWSRRTSSRILFAADVTCESACRRPSGSAPAAPGAFDYQTQRARLKPGVWAAPRLFPAEEAGGGAESRQPAAAWSPRPATKEFFTITLTDACKGSHGKMECLARGGFFVSAPKQITAANSFD
jgi:hypothetical protein